MFEEWFGHKLRAFLFLLSSTGIWLVWCLGPLLANEPSRFQATGSIIVAWGIFSFGRNKIKREKSIAMTEKNELVSAIEYIRQQLSFHESLATNTANVHTLQHYQLLETLGMNYENGPDLEKEIAHFEKLTGDHSNHNRLHAELLAKQKTALNDATRMKSVRSEQQPWVQLLTKLELFFVIFGTLQWGYGDVWVELLHNELIPLLNGKT